MYLNMILYFIFLLIISFMFIFLSVSMYFLDFSLMFEWLLISLNSINLEFYFLIDWCSLIFIGIVMLISSMVMLYSVEYMSNDMNLSRFYNLIFLFVFSMVFMIISPNILSILIGWDGLGVTSYCLVIYYNNYISFNSGMVTILINRLGDIGILMAISLMLICGSWNICMMMENKLIMFMLVIAGITKSAQIPFSSWLPMAMAAPTPVSSLVHSSTLVTAGVYLLIRFNYYLMLNNLNSVLLFLSILTMFMSGLMANFENDLKKIIALSTLSQLGLMMMIISLGFSMMSLYHLLTHALFKSLLFLCVGILIHSMNNNQDIRKYGNMIEEFPFTMMSFYISSMALCGYPFLAGFYSKDLIMEILYSGKINIIMFILSLVSLMFTVSYSLRLFYYVFFNKIKFSSYLVSGESVLMSFSMVILMFFSVIGGSLLNWLFFFYYIIFLSLMFKMLTMLMCLVGITVLLMLHMTKINLNLLYFVSSMWMMNYMYIYMNKPLLKVSKIFNKIEKSWIEYLSKDIYLNFFKFIFFSLHKYSFIYKSYMFLMYLIYIIIFLLYFF